MSEIWSHFWSHSYFEPINFERRKAHFSQQIKLFKTTKPWISPRLFAVWTRLSPFGRWTQWGPSKKLRGFNYWLFDALDKGHMLLKKNKPEAAPLLPYSTI
jgi:hypothetical protein